MLLEEQMKLRHTYIGGSDVPIILGASKFKKPWDLLLEKAQIKVSDFGGNIYSELGNILEPRIQAGLNLVNVDEITYQKQYQNVDFQCHIDGLNQEGNEIQEIKVANQTIDECYKSYEWQVRTYMYVVGIQNANLILLPRTGDLKSLVSHIIRSYDLGFLHDFNQLDELDVKQAVQDLNDGVANIKLYKRMFHFKKITHDPKKEAYMLSQVSRFWEFKERLDEDNKLVSNPNFIQEFNQHFNY